MGKNAKANFGWTDENAVMQYFCVKGVTGTSGYGNRWIGMVAIISELGKWPPIGVNGNSKSDSRGIPGLGPGSN